MAAGALTTIEPVFSIAARRSRTVAALAHDEQVGRRRFHHGVGGDQFDAEASLRQSLADSSHDRGVVIDAARRVGGLAQDAHAGEARVHAPAFSGERRNPACSAASTSRARSMSNTSGRDNAIDRPAFVDQPFEIVAQTVEARRRRRDPMRRKPVEAGRDMAALIAAKPKNAPVLVQSRP